MKTTCLLLFALCASLVHAVAGEPTNLISSRVLDRPLADVRAAIQSYCTRSDLSLRSWKSNDVAGVSHTAWWSDCTPPVRTPYVTGTFVATSITPRRTRLDIFCAGSIGEDAVMGKRYLEAIAGQLDKKP